MRSLRIRFASTVLLVVALSMVVSQVKALQTLYVERPDRTVALSSLLSNCNNQTQSDAGVSLTAYTYQYSYLYGPPYYGDFVNMNVSMAANVRRVPYLSEGYTANDPFYSSNSWKWTPYITLNSYTNLPNDSGFWVNLTGLDCRFENANFTFIFYGVKYKGWTGQAISSHIWVCTNGFISLDPSRLNTTCPSAFPSNAPRAVIAPFWTGLDFVKGTSEIDTAISWESELGYYFIVKWVNMRERGTNNFCTFDAAFRVYDMNKYDPCEYQSPDDPDGIHITSGDIWFAYYNLETPASSFAMGVEDQTGYNFNGGLMPASYATYLNGTAYLYHVLDKPYIKNMILTFHDSDPNGSYCIAENNTYGRNLRSLPNPGKDSSLTFAYPDNQLVDTSMDVGGALVSIDDLVENGAILGSLATPVGVVFLGYGLYSVGKDVFNWWVSNQYKPAQTTFSYNQFPNPSPNKLTQAEVSAPAYDNYTKQSDTVIDASLETSFMWVVGYDYLNTHTLTITATVEYGDWDNPNYDNTASTSVNLTLFPSNNYGISNAQQVSYGFCGDNPMLYLGQSPPGQSYEYQNYYSINVNTNYGTMVYVHPISSGLDFSMEVLDSNHNCVASASQPGHGADESMRFVPTYNGTYYIYIYSVNGWGFYNMNITEWAVFSVAINPYMPGAGSVYPKGAMWYNIGKLVYASEKPYNSSYYFVGWSVDGSTTLDPSYPFISYSGTLAYVTMNQNHALVAYFELNSSNTECPYVSAWNGSSYVLDNDVLPASEYSGTADVTDYYLLPQTLAQRSDGTYSLQLSELGIKHDFFDSVQLVAVDHASNVNVAVSPIGQVLTYTTPHLPVSAITNDHKDVRYLLRGVKGKYYQGYNGSYITLNFGDLDVSQGAKLVVGSDRIITKCPVYIQTMNSSGRWQTVATIYMRINWTTDIVDMSKYLPDARDHLMVRLLFTSNDKIDFVGLDTSPQATIHVQQGQLISAIRTTDVPPLSFSANVTTELLSNDQTYAELLPSQEINLTFTLSSQTMEARSYIIIVEGHYCLITQ